ncbi:MAG: AarF/UbiB family protein [Syntrophales bacterium]|jgi:ubiquinone biosynthesis protein|nr:AarF/UbiB family protein [Syntrophales bacterium]MDY0044047.1 AarF/UbiB family protein [Syntrophales bacterium]
MLIRKRGVVSRTYRHISRYRQILGVLMAYGYGDLVDRLDVEQYLEIGSKLVSRKRAERVEKLSRAERIRIALEDLGSTFIKLGQILSTRPDVVPPDIVKELEKLQDEVPPFPFQEARKAVEEETGKPINEIFTFIDEKPLAAASIGQVHRARLLGGEEVIVKVRRPGITGKLEVDLEILLHLAMLAEKHIEEIAIYRPAKIVEEFSRTLENEMDYTIEAAYAERFARQFFDNPTVYVPKIITDFSTERVLVMEYVQGVKASEIHLLEDRGLDRRIIAERGADLLLRQVFDYGFFHADPHPGNIIILPGNVICYLDFGMMGTVDRKSRENMADMAYAIVKRNEEKATDALLEMVEVDGEPDRRILETDVATLMEMYVYKSLKEIRIEKILQQMLDIISKHRLHLPYDKFLMMKALATMEGLGLRLDPDFDLTRQAAPFIKRIKIKQFSPWRLMDDFVSTGADLMRLFRVMPDEIYSILKQARLGKIRLVLDNTGIIILAQTLERIGTRISLALIAGALIIGSYLFISTGKGFSIFGIPILGLAGFILAGFLAIVMIAKK